MMPDLPFFQIIPVTLRGLSTVSSNGRCTEERLTAAIEWIQYAHNAADDGGISKGYDLWRGRWVQSYPETTGYTIPSLLNVAVFLKRPELRTMAFSLADYLLSRVTPEGGVAHWQAGSKPYPIVFDTGQVMFGWLAAFEVSGDERYLQAAVRAGDWLASVQHSTGSWKEFQHLDVEKVIDTRVAWALLRLHQYTNKETHRQAAVRNLEWALQQQDTDGWFRHCAFVESEDPFTHTLAYTAEGLFECGQLLQEERYIDGSRLMADALLARQYADGSLASTYDSRWRETSRSSCLTGNCQMACLWLSFYEFSGNKDYYKAAEKAITFVARTQILRTANSNIRGAIAGSYPVYGCYERFKYPNWAVKFFIDAMLALENIESQGNLLLYVG
jgi:hypothetical protein